MSSNSQNIIRQLYALVENLWGGEWVKVTSKVSISKKNVNILYSAWKFGDWGHNLCTSLNKSSKFNECVLRMNKWILFVEFYLFYYEYLLLYIQCMHMNVCDFRCAHAEVWRVHLRSLSGFFKMLSLTELEAPHFSLLGYPLSSWCPSVFATPTNTKYICSQRHAWFFYMGVTDSHSCSHACKSRILNHWI